MDDGSMIMNNTCEDCGNLYDYVDGRYYKYEPDVWLCDSCYDERMEDD